MNSTGFPLSWHSEYIKYCLPSDLTALTAVLSDLNVLECWLAGKPKNISSFLVSNINIYRYSVNAVFEDEIGDVIIHSIFGDGCAAMVIGAIEQEQEFSRGKVVIKDHLSYLAPETKDGIVLGLKDNGITCKLSRQLPDYIEAGVGPIIEGFLASHQLTKENIDLWAIHPGGTRIIEKSQLSLGLRDDQVADSWEILRQYGNMLSPSVLFVLQRMILRRNQDYPLADLEDVGLNNQHNQAQKSSEKLDVLTGIAFSFSPGIGVEGILFQLG